MRTLILLLLSLPLIAQDPYKNIYSSHAWAQRDQWQRPDDLIALMRIGQGSIVADIGCHEGYMTFKLSREVGETGRVFAVDVDASKLDRMNSIIKERELNNITTVKGDYDNPKLPVGTLDAVVILDTYHEMDHHDKILSHVLIALKPGGRLLLCEPISDSRRDLSREEQERKHEIAMLFAVDDVIRAGFTVMFQREGYIDRRKEKGDRMWVIVAEKRKEP